MADHLQPMPLQHLSYLHRNVVNHKLSPLAVIMRKRCEIGETLPRQEYRVAEVPSTEARPCSPRPAISWLRNKSRDLSSSTSRLTPTGRARLGLGTEPSLALAGVYPGAGILLTAWYVIYARSFAADVALNRTCSRYVEARARLTFGAKWRPMMPP